MSTYQTTRIGSFTLEGATIPNSKGNRHYKQLQAEVAEGTSTILPYTQDIDDLRREKRAQIVAFSLDKMSALVPAISTVEMVDLMVTLWPMLNTGAAPADLLSVRDIYIYTKQKLNQLGAATREQLESYDPSTDNGWP